MPTRISPMADVDPLVPRVCHSRLKRRRHRHHHREVLRDADAPLAPALDHEDALRSDVVSPAASPLSESPRSPQQEALRAAEELRGLLESVRSAHSVRLGRPVLPPVTAGEAAPADLCVPCDAVPAH